MNADEKLRLALYPELLSPDSGEPSPPTPPQPAKVAKTGRSGSGLSTRDNCGPPPPPPEPTIEELSKLSTDKLRQMAGIRSREPERFSDFDLPE